MQMANALCRLFGSDRPYDQTTTDMVDQIAGVEESEEWVIMYGIAAVGATRFARIGGNWCMIWVMISEEYQRRGILTAAYPQFEARYGRFSVAPPYSEGMCRFLEKITRQEDPRLAGGHAVAQQDQERPLDQDPREGRGPGRVVLAR